MKRLILFTLFLLGAIELFSDNWEPISFQQKSIFQTDSGAYFQLICDSIFEEEYSNTYFINKKYYDSISNNCKLKPSWIQFEGIKNDYDLVFKKDENSINFNYLYQDTTDNYFIKFPLNLKLNQIYEFNIFQNIQANPLKCTIKLLANQTELIFGKPDSIKLYEFQYANQEFKNIVKFSKNYGIIEILHKNIMDIDPKTNPLNIKLVGAKIENKEFGYQEEVINSYFNWKFGDKRIWLHEESYSFPHFEYFKNYKIDYITNVEIKNNYYIITYNQENFDDINGYHKNYYLKDSVYLPSFKNAITNNYKTYTFDESFTVFNYNYFSDYYFSNKTYLILHKYLPKKIAFNDSLVNCSYVEFFGGYIDYEKCKYSYISDFGGQGLYFYKGFGCIQINSPKSNYYTKLIGYKQGTKEWGVQTVTSGINEIETNKNIYPNPVKSGSQLNLNKIADCIILLDILGNELMKINNTDRMTIPSNLTQGIYFVKCINGNAVNLDKLIIE